MATSGTHRGWLRDRTNARLAAVYDGTEIFDFDANDMAVTIAATFAAVVNGTLGFRANTSNVFLGNPGAFATTQPQGAVVMGGSSLSGIAPVGAITTAGAVFASDTAVMKIVAGGTATAVET